MIINQNTSFISTLSKYLLKKSGIKIKTVASYNQQSLQAECGFKFLATILMKHITRLGQFGQIPPICNVQVL